MATYYVYSGAGGSANGTSWANAYTTMATAFSGKAAGDVFYVAHDHAESTASSITLTAAGTIANPTKVICANRSGSVPPVSADRRTTAQVATTLTGVITLNGCVHYDGIIFNCGTTSGANLVMVGTASGIWQRYDNCSMRLLSTAACNIVVGNSSSGGSLIEWNNTTVSFNVVGQAITGFSTLRWRNTPSAVLGTMPTALFTPSTSKTFVVECFGVDLSAMGSGKTIVAAAQSGAVAETFKFIDCKLHASVTKSDVPTSHGSTTVDFIRSGATGVNYAVYNTRVSGLLIEETTIVRTGGASDGTTPISWKIVTTANCTYSMPFECPPIAIWNDTTGSAKTATVEGIWGGGAVPLDDEIWLDVEYLGDASSPQGSFVNDGKADLLATAANQTASSETWGGSTTKFKLAVSFTAQQKGWIYARVKIARASSTFYIDPLITLT